eukprot:6480193-Amphidinium_carterae.1
MGWHSAVAFTQHIHQQLLRTRLPDECRLRGDRSMAQDRWGSLHHFYQVYIDNVDQAEVAVLDEVAELCTSWSKAVESAGHDTGIPYSSKKRERLTTKCETLGAEILGERGVLQPSRRRLSRIWGLAHHILGSERINPRELRILLGMLVFIFQFRRPAMSCLDVSWQAVVDETILDEFAHVVRMELMCCLGLFPLLRFDMRWRTRGMVTCSDASLRGAGVCRSAGLSLYGRVLLKELQLAAENHGRTEIILIDVYAGAGGVRMALERMGVQVHRHAVWEPDAHAAWVLKTAFPDAELMQVPTKHLNEWLGNFVGFGPVDAVILLAFTPPASSWTQLVQPAPGEARMPLGEVVALFQACLYRASRGRHTAVLYESVVLEDLDLLEDITKFLGVLPMQVCGSSFSQTWRPRLMWLSWDMPTEPEIEYEVTSDRVLVHLPSRWCSPTAWADQGWRPVSVASALPTFVRPIPRKYPPKNPSGYQQVDAATLQRWEADEFRFPPYQYEMAAMMVNQFGVLRVASPNERELLLGYPLDHTYPIADRAERASTQRHSDARNALLGKASHIGVLMWLLSPLLAEQGAILRALSAKQIAECFGWNAEHDNAHHEDEEALLTKFLLSRSSRRGQDIKINLWRQGSRPQLAHPLSTRCWEWKVCFGSQWKDTHEHINALELRAFYLTVKWLARQPHLYSSR